MFCAMFQTYLWKCFMPCFRHMFENVLCCVSGITWKMFCAVFQAYLWKCFVPCFRHTFENVLCPVSGIPLKMFCVMFQAYLWKCFVPCFRHTFENVLCCVSDIPLKWRQHLSSLTNTLLRDSSTWWAIQVEMEFLHQVNQCSSVKV